MRVLERANSVLDVAWELAERAEFPIFDAIIAREQTAGRGQYGRTWISPKGNIYAAIRLPAVAPFNNTEAALALACCVAATLDKFGFKTHIKWMNDLVIGGGKVAGILLEQKGDVLIAGIGVNLRICPNAVLLKDGAALPAACLYNMDAEAANRMTPEIFVEKLVDYLRNLDLVQFSNKWLDCVRPRLLWLNESVVLEANGERMAGVLAGIDRHGGLLLVTQNGLKTGMRGVLTKA